MFRDIATQSGTYLWTKSFLLQKRGSGANTRFGLVEWQIQNRIP